MITDTGIWTIVINLIAIAFAVQYSRSETFGDALLWLVWDFTGLRFVWEKIHPPPEQKPDGYTQPATIAVWAFGLFSLYIAVYGLASQRYENAVDKIENRMNAFITQLAVVKTPEVRSGAFGEIREIQQMQCPVFPELLKPSTVYFSLTKEDIYHETVTVLTRTVEKYSDNLQGAWLKGANLNGARLDGANLKDARLGGANLIGAWFRGANLNGAWFEGANLRGTVLTGANLKDARLDDANLQDVRLVDSNLEGAWLDGANLQDASLIKANLEDARLNDANLQSARLIKANLAGARLNDANLQDADLVDSNLEGAILVDSNLEGAWLRGAKLQGAVLWGANLVEVGYLPTDQLCSAKTLYKATMDQEIEAQVKQQCPAKLDKPKQE